MKFFFVDTDQQSTDVGISVQRRYQLLLILFFLAALPLLLCRIKDARDRQKLLRSELIHQYIWNVKENNRHAEHSSEVRKMYRKNQRPITTPDAQTVSVADSALLLNISNANLLDRFLNAQDTFRNTITAYCDDLGPVRINPLTPILIPAQDSYTIDEIQNAQLHFIRALNSPKDTETLLIDHVPYSDTVHFPITIDSPAREVTYFFTRFNTNEVYEQTFD